MIQTRIQATFVALAIVMTATLVFAHEHAEQGKFIVADQVEFQDIIPGVVAFGTVSGNRESGSHGTFVRIPPGQATPLHSHGAAYEAVVIQGRLENPIEGNESSNVTLTSGSFYSVPAGARHITRCAADSPVACITYFFQNVPFDFTLAE